MDPLQNDLKGRLKSQFALKNIKGEGAGGPRWLGGTPQPGKYYARYALGPTMGRLKTIENLII